MMYMNSEDSVKAFKRTQGVSRIYEKTTYDGTPTVYLVSQDNHSMVKLAMASFSIAELSYQKDDNKNEVILEYNIVAHIGPRSFIMGRYPVLTGTSPDKIPVKVMKELMTLMKDGEFYEDALYLEKSIPSVKFYRFLTEEEFTFSSPQDELDNNPVSYFEEL